MASLKCRQLHRRHGESGVTGTVTASGYWCCDRGWTPAATEWAGRDSMAGSVRSKTALVPAGKSPFHRFDLHNLTVR
ncbi:hypothetical protein F2I39_22375 [Escherichia coli]|nr:hypothetical protein [Escherichia coli]EFE8233896.1 hypothetical protein [Escherichia coli]